MAEPSGPPDVALVETDAADPRSVALCARLDDEMRARYSPGQVGESAEIAVARAEALRVHPADVAAVLLAVDGEGAAIGHVMLRRLPAAGSVEWELKRLIVVPEARGRGTARALVAAVIARASREGAARLILQTGDPQHESLALYTSMGFTPIPVYEPYAYSMPRSRCFALAL